MINSSFINGRLGRYDYKIHDDSVRYARNSVDNFKKETELRECVTASDVRLTPADAREFTIAQGELHKAIALMDRKLPSLPFNYVQQYSTNPKGRLDTVGLMGVAYEEMGKKTSVSLWGMNKKLEKAEAAIFGKNSEIKMSADVLDLNQDGRIDLAEYSSMVLVRDALSEKPYVQDVKNIDGIITSKGQKRALAFMLKDCEFGARNILQGLYTKFGLGVAQNFFMENKNNLVE